MKDRTRPMQKEAAMEAAIRHLMDELDAEETTELLKDANMSITDLNQSDIEHITEGTLKKLNMEASNKIRVDATDIKAMNTEEKQGRPSWIRTMATAAAVLLCIVALKNGNHIVYAFQQALSLIPGVGILENNEDILYQLEEPVFAENDQAELKITSAVATAKEITISFEVERKNYTEEQMLADKQAEWESLEKGNNPQKPGFYLLVEDQKYEGLYGMSGSGLTENYTFSFEPKPEEISPGKNYQLVYEDYNISADFRLITLEQYSSLKEIGSTGIHNDISLTATSSLENNQLKVHVYPLNYSSYKLISFEQEYDFNYFGKKLVLRTDHGDKTYTLPDSYGSGMNAAYSFDVSDGAKDYTLSIPYVVVESKEEEKVTLPIPKPGEIIEVNKEVTFESGSVMITSVEKLVSPGGNEYGDLKVNLEYKSAAENQQLVSVELTKKASEGWSLEFDEENRVKAINYMLEKSDKKKLKLYIVKPRYVLMEEYLLDLNDSKQH